MKSPEASLELLLARVLDEFAYEIDANYEDEDIGLLATEDSTFRTFRRALEELQARKVAVSRLVLHVQTRIEKAYDECFEGGLPPLEDDD